MTKTNFAKQLKVDNGQLTNVFIKFNKKIKQPYANLHKFCRAKLMTWLYCNSQYKNVEYKICIEQLSVASYYLSTTLVLKNFGTVFMEK